MITELKREIHPQQEILNQRLSDLGQAEQIVNQLKNPIDNLIEDKPIGSSQTSQTVITTNKTNDDLELTRQSVKNIYGQIN